jgi:hypothetical protein
MQHAGAVEVDANDISEVRPVVTPAVWSQPRATLIPRDADELTTLKAYLDYYRETVELKCVGVPPERLSVRSVPPSTMSLHGLVRHLSCVERWWFATSFAGLDVPMLYYSDDEPDQDFDSLDADPLDALETWRSECDRSRGIVDSAPSLDATGAVERGGPYTLRWLLLRMIAEYAQHAGHADLLRERIDGAVGA